MKKFENKKDMMAALVNGTLFEEKVVMSDEIVIPKSYQRQLNKSRVKSNLKVFDPYKVHKPRLSYRDGKYYAWDGQHTIKLLEAVNGGPVPIRCEVVYTFTEEDEAYEFSIQNEGCKNLNVYEKFHASIVSGMNDDDLQLQNLTELAGFEISSSGGTCSGKLTCINKAKGCIKKYGQEAYVDGLSIIRGAWKSAEGSLHQNIVGGACRFARVFHGEFDFHKLCDVLGEFNISDIRKRADAMDDNKTIDQHYAYQMAVIYNKRARNSNRLEEYKALGVIPNEKEKGRKKR